MNTHYVLAPGGGGGGVASLFLINSLQYGGLRSRIGIGGGFEGTPPPRFERSRKFFFSPYPVAAFFLVGSLRYCAPPSHSLFEFHVNRPNTLLDFRTPLGGLKKEDLLALFPRRPFSLLLSLFGEINIRIILRIMLGNSHG